MRELNSMLEGDKQRRKKSRTLLHTQKIYHHLYCKSTVLNNNFLFFFLLARMTTWRLELKQLLGHLWSLKKKRLECLISKKEDAWFHRAHQPWDQHLQDLPWEKLIIIICVWFTELFSCNQNLIQTNKLSCFFHMSSQDG